MHSQACRLRRRLQKDGNELSRQLGMLVPALDDLESRRQFLAARRALFNARELPGGAWQETLRRRDEPLADAVEAWNRRHFAWRRLLNARDERFAADRETCDRGLMRLCRQDAIRRGIALVHNGLASELSSSGEDGRYSCSGRRDRRLMSTPHGICGARPCDRFPAVPSPARRWHDWSRRRDHNSRPYNSGARRSRPTGRFFALWSWFCSNSRRWRASRSPISADCFANDEGCWAIPPTRRAAYTAPEMEPRDCRPASEPATIRSRLGPALRRTDSRPTRFETYCVAESSSATTASPTRSSMTSRS